LQRYFSQHRSARSIVWGLVGIPLTWGVVQTLISALKLFQ
jgi:hypothetical protein